MIVDEFADLWARATPAEKKEIRKMVELAFEPPTTKLMRKQADNVLSFLNEKTRKNYFHVETNLKPIISLLKSGITEEQIYAVIAMRYRKWASDSKMDEYLRPKTLFNVNNFHQYLGEVGK